MRIKLNSDTCPPLVNQQGSSNEIDTAQHIQLEVAATCFQGRGKL